MTTTDFRTGSDLRTVLLCVLFLVLSACASAPPDDVQRSVYDEPGLTNDKAAILDWSGSNAPTVFAIDGKQPTGNGVRVAPGKHEVRWGGRFGVSALYGRTSIEYNLTDVLDLQASHVYDLHRERFHFFDEFSDFLWIEDRTTGEIIAGKAPPYDRDRLQRSSNAVGDRASTEQFKEISVSAACGDIAAQKKLALYYLAALPPVDSRNLPLVYRWYSVAASRGDGEAARIRDRLVSEMTSAQLAEGRRLFNDTKLLTCEPPKPADSGLPSFESEYADAGEELAT